MMANNNIRNLTVGIVGLGFVGNAIDTSLKRRSIKTRVYDKYKNGGGGIGEISDVIHHSDIIFLCLPTPTNLCDLGYDISAIEEVCSQLSKSDYCGPVILKSTVCSGTTEKLANCYNLQMLHNPEFLTARTAVEDFDNQSHIVLGWTNNLSKKNKTLVECFYYYHYPHADLTMTVSGQSELMKQFCNSFYAIKIQIFNEFYLLSEKLGLDYDQIVQMMLKNGWINENHTRVPGPDGRLSYGGGCFPKDTTALLHLMKCEEVPCQVLDACIRERNSLREDP